MKKLFSFVMDARNYMLKFEGETSYRIIFLYNFEESEDQKPVFFV